MRANGWQLCESSYSFRIIKDYQKRQITRHWQWTDKNPLKAEQTEEHLKLKTDKDEQKQISLQIKKLGLNLF